MAKQLKNIKKLSELLASGKIETKKYDLSGYYFKSGLHWWIMFMPMMQVRIMFMRVFSFFMFMNM